MSLDMEEYTDELMERARLQRSFGGAQNRKETRSETDEEVVANDTVKVIEPVYCDLTCGK